MGRLLPCAMLGLAIMLTARDVAAVDAFEIQVHDGTANRPGVPGLEMHLNRVFNGVKTATAPELPLHRQTHVTFEPSIGVTPFLELGGYMQSTLLADGTLDYAGTKLRTKFVTPAGWAEHLRLGVNLELALLSERYDQGRVGGEIRPIIAWENDRVILAANPNVGVPLGPPGASDGPSFEPAAMAKVKVAGVIALGVEYYGDLGPIASPAPSSGQVHYVYEVIDLISVPHFELNAGIGEGLTEASNALVAKMILGYAWDR